MLILTIRTDKPEAEIGLYESDRQLAYTAWEAHRQLAETLHQRIADMLTAQGRAWVDVEGIIVFEGPGSFTGLRIGLSVANALAYAQTVPIVATGGGNWLADGQHRLAAGENDSLAMPEYGALPHITQAKK